MDPPMIYGENLDPDESKNVQISDKPENYPLSPYLKNLLTLEALRFNNCLDSHSVIDDGKNLSVLGKGHYGVVLKLNENEAFKTLPENMLFTGDEAWRRLLKEFRIWKTITDSTENEKKCQHIAQVISLRSYAVCRYRHKFIGIVSTLYRCNLGNYITEQKNKSKYNRMEVLRIIQQIIEAVQFLHGIKIIHGDIAVRNFLIKGERDVVICDFGLSHKLKRVEQSTPNENFSDKTKWSTLKNNRWKDLFKKFKLYYKDNMNHYDFYYKDKMDQITEETVKDQLLNESLDKKNIYKNFYRDLNPQDQPFWWCSPELCQQVLDNANQKNQNSNNDLPGIITNFASDEYMIGCTIAELITIEDNFVPFSSDYRYQKGSSDANLLQFSGLTALEKCINLKKFNCLKIPEKNLIKDCSNLRFYYEELTKPKITDRCLLAQVKSKIDLQVKPNNKTYKTQSPMIQPISYFAAINLQALVGSVETKLFDQKIKNMIRKRNHELVAYATLEEKDSYKSIETILNQMPADSKPEKIDAALIYLNSEQIKNYQGNNTDQHGGKFCSKTGPFQTIAYFFRLYSAFCCNF